MYLGRSFFRFMMEYTKKDAQIDAASREQPPANALPPHPRIHESIYTKQR